MSIFFEKNQRIQFDEVFDSESNGGIFESTLYRSLVVSYGDLKIWNRVAATAYANLLRNFFLNTVKKPKCIRQVLRKEVIFFNFS